MLEALLRTLCHKMDVEILVNEDRTQCKLQMPTPAELAIFFETVMMVVAGVMARYALAAGERTDPTDDQLAPFVAGPAPAAPLLGRDGLRVVRLPRPPRDAGLDAALAARQVGRVPPEPQAPRPDPLPPPPPDEP